MNFDFVGNLLPARHAETVGIAPQILGEVREMQKDSVLGIPLLDATAFNPADHPALLQSVMLYKLIEGRYKCTLVGEIPRSHLPMKIAGEFVDDAMPPKNLPDLYMRFNAAFENGCPNFAEKTMAWQCGLERIGYRALNLPFVDADGSPSRILSVMDFQVARLSASELR